MLTRYIRIAMLVPICIPLFNQRGSGQSKFPCDTTTCLTIGPPKTQQGWIVGEIRAFGFGGDSKNLLDQLAVQGWVECAGQSAIRKDFDQLWKVIGTDWGSADKTNVFYLPDLRGMFLRAWNHGKQAPVNHPGSPYNGDVDNTSRLSPRPEAGEAGGIPGPTGDRVGSFQPTQISSHQHSFEYKTWGSAERAAYAPPPTPEDTLRGPVTESSITKVQADASKETHPSNAYVMYMIYVGVPVNVLAPSSDSPTGQIVPHK